MKRLLIDRFDGKFAICQDKEGQSFAIELSELPKEAKQGSVLDISDQGELSISTEKSEFRIKKKKF